jgi:hypothetical protein
VNNLLEKRVAAALGSADNGDGESAVRGPSSAATSEGSRSEAGASAKKIYPAEAAAATATAAAAWGNGLLRREAECGMRGHGRSGAVS